MTSPDRSELTTSGVAEDIWTFVGLPSSALTSLHLPSADTIVLPSSYKIGVLAQATIGASALAAAQYYALRNNLHKVPDVTVPLDHARLEFHSQQYQSLDTWAQNPPDVGINKVGGLHRTSDGYVRIHDLFPNHVAGTMEILGLPRDATKQQVADKTIHWDAVDLETKGTEEGKVAIYAQRTCAEWDALPQSTAVATAPILLRQLHPGPTKVLPPTGTQNKALSGLKVVELTRVIAGPVAGRTLAAHGADVLWVTSPSLPAVPFLDSDMSRGKRTIQLDIRSAADKATLLDLLRTADVFLQGYRPESLAAHGLSPADLTDINPSLVVANLSAFGPGSPWSRRRGFDSLVQTASGMTVSEAEHADEGESARVTPVQALDHGSGYLLATGIMAALHRRATEGGSWRVDVSLAGTMKYLRSLGQYPGRQGFDGVEPLPASIKEVPGGFVDVKQSAVFGKAMALKHSARINGVEVGYDDAPKPLGSDEPKWKDA
ncbi:hypothetical protein LMH87_001081 [Akanthomyces muscarius]|uniref:CAIB/BAIF family enzyme n=1 Tax=Akanthomyces muscarius TaxID=2231603 RepID=A0A9W8UPE9_AKAMU|nr:hypothetical protein LMH87_001081 [Akanthomyces muscarius]KAJ4155856.1 hypothetical protein LMH87_001081 [Akanthomyces muscarius]